MLTIARRLRRWRRDVQALALPAHLDRHATMAAIKARPLADTVDEWWRIRQQIGRR